MVRGQQFIDDNRKLLVVKTVERQFKDGLNWLNWFNWLKDKRKGQAQRHKVKRQRINSKQKNKEHRGKNGKPGIFK